MKKYMEDGVFTVYPNSFVYVERTLENGSVREGLVGMVDLDAYDYTPGATSAPSAPPSAPYPNASRLVSVSAATLRLNCRMC